ncbi:hypothetical protein Ctob_003256 [Chrysochromulina tobinii]|uniref:Uncharacterized protein n=1 Tax=Chrysochromulina tobinii TaxID=1460289 RepID=A0A0M0J9T5_9EUKA|nr:hypothetical protein Ctob_003256 [Chrysochromulina tobinii]|eukprot:KOO22953.1 hypothetical protein Ctob_003256 [Chrysochromulina sp. CCMP291]
MAQKPAVLWQPVGSYAIYLAEVEQPGDAAVRGISDVLARLPTGEPLPLRRSIPTQEDGNLTVDGAQYDARAATLAVGRSVLDEHGGGPLLLSRFANMLYERLPTSREVLKKSGGAAAWCEEQGIHMASGSPDESRAETIWLAKADALEVDALMWLPWMLLQSRRNYEDPIPLRNRLDVRIHPYFARWVLRSRGVEKIVAGDLVRRHFDRVNGIECSDLSVGSGGLARVITPFMKPPAKVRDNGRAM